MPAAVVTVLIDLPAGHRFHVATLSALAHAADARGIEIAVQVVPTDAIHNPGQLVSGSSAVLIGPGSPYRDPAAALAVVRDARERDIPLVGT